MDGGETGPVPDKHEWCGCLGLGSLLAVILAGFAASALYASCNRAGAGGALLCQAMFAVGMCVACPALRLASQATRDMPWCAISLASEVVLAAGLCLVWAVSLSQSGEWASCLSCLACGGAAMCLLARWFCWLVRICSQQGTQRCIGALVRSCLCMTAVSLPGVLCLTLQVSGPLMLVCCLIPVAAETIAHTRTFRAGSDGTHAQGVWGRRATTGESDTNSCMHGQTKEPGRLYGRMSSAISPRNLAARPSCPQDAVPCPDGTTMRLAAEQGGSGAKHVSSHATRYRMSPYALALLTSFGITWGISVYHVATGLTDNPACAIACLSAILLASLAAVAAQHVRPTWPQAPFGLIVRMSIAVSGALLAALPLLVQAAPATLPLVGTVVCATQSLSMTLFAIESCSTTGLDVCTVLTTNFMVYGSLGCVAILGSYVLGSHLEPALALAAITFVATAASMLAIPMLPSRNSAAATFTLDELPESKGLAERTADACGALSSRCGLTTRESSVLRLIVKGMSRQAIAEELSLSAWTVRDYAGSVYKKCGVHSAKELMALVAKEA